MTEANDTTESTLDTYHREQDERFGALWTQQLEEVKATRCNQGAFLSDDPEVLRELCRRLEVVNFVPKDMVDTSGEADDLSRKLDEALALNAKLKEELTRVGQDADAIQSENLSLSASLALTKERLEDLRRMQVAAEARATLFHDLAKKLKRMVD